MPYFFQNRTINSITNLSCSDSFAKESLSNPILILIPILACEKSYFSHALSSYVLFLSQTRNILYYIIQSKYTFSFSFVHYKKLPNDIITIIGSFSPTHSFSLYTCLSYSINFTNTLQSLPSLYKTFFLIFLCPAVCIFDCFVPAFDHFFSLCGIDLRLKCLVDCPVFNNILFT